MADIAAGAAVSRSSSELRGLSLVSIAHCVSHYHILILPMLYPFLKERLQSDFVAIALSMSVFGVVSGFTQAPLGYIVDRFGARKVLITGLVIGGLSLVLLGLNLNYATLLVCGALLGLANSVYHPADYALLAANIDSSRIGRAFSIHSFAGFVGSAVTPASASLLLQTFGGEVTLIISGLIALLVAVLLVLVPMPEAGGKTRSPASNGAPVSMLTPTIMLLTAFFMLVGFAFTGPSAFGIVALTSGYDVSFASASLAVTGFLSATAIGVLAGGVLADWTRHHARVAMVCFAINAALVLAITVTTPAAPMLAAALTAAGFLGGVMTPSRDMLVREAAPAGTAGRAFGIVSTGFNFSGVLGPLLFAYAMDQGAPRWVFGFTGLFMAVALLLMLVTDRRAAGASLQRA